jgi:DNA ligase (NAD+)
MSDSIKAKKDLLRKYRIAYYNDEPIVSDATYDALHDEIEKLDPNDDEIVDIGAEPVSEWKKYQHKSPLGSLNKCNTEQQFLKWANDYCSDEQFFTTWKIDGLSVSLVYEDGKLVVAATRGGKSGIGEDITVNVLKMQGVPKTLPNKITATVRGEIVLSKENHQKYFQNYSNARNSASGIARAYDGEGCKYLEILTYQIQTDDLDNKTLVDQFVRLRQLGFNIPDYSLFDTAKDTYAYFTRFQNEIRDTIPYDLDGLVISNNNMDKFDSYGMTNNKPKAAIAAKFENEEAETTVRDIRPQCGNSGRITPVAVFDEVELAGAKITNASCYNMSFLETMEIDIGARVIVARNNDVIPSVKEVIEGTGTVFKAPKHCPTCNGDLVMNGENLQCTNVDNCPAQIKGRISNWISGLNVLEVGDGLIDKLVEAGLVATPADLYKLTLDDLAGLERMGKKSAENVYKSLWSITEIPLDTFLGSLSIPIVGKSSIKMVMNAGLDTLDKIMNAPENCLQAVKGLGVVKAKNLFDGLKKNRKIIEELLELGIKVKTMSNTGKLNGFVITITGKTSVKRDDLAIMIEEAGGKYAKTIGKASTHLVCASEDSTSLKTNKARSAGVKIISENELMSMIEE